MTTVITPVNAYAASLSIPADGEGVSAASVALYVQEIANRLEFIRRRTPGANPSANLLRLSKTAGEAILFPGTANYQIGLTATTLPVVNNLVLSATETFCVQLDSLVPGTIVRAFHAVYRGAPAHAALPAVMPVAQLCRIDLSAYLGSGAAPTPTSISTISDTSGTTAAFQGAHLISDPAFAYTVGANDMVFIRCYGESGANALVGGQWSGFMVDVSG